MELNKFFPKLMHDALIWSRPPLRGLIYYLQYIVEKYSQESRAAKYVIYFIGA